jgi:hypothetical protein
MESMRHIRYVCLLIAVVAVIQLALSSTSVAQFVREEISIRVHGSYCTLDGRYEFKNTQNDAALWPIFYPLLSTVAIPLADSIRIYDADTAEPLPFESGSNGVSFSIPMPPLGSKTIQITYRQRTPKERMEYILTTTKKWGKPLERATFRVIVPDSLRLTHISIPYDSLMKRGHDVEHLIRKKAFMPRSDLVVKWERRKQ